MPSPSMHTPTPHRREGSAPWWEPLGLRPAGTRPASANERHVEAAVLAMLAQHPPVAFAGDTPDATLTGEALAALAQQAAERVARAQDAAAAERARLGWAHIEAALAGPSAAEMLDGGRWAGFTRGEATAWLWNLLQFEPHGYAPPGALLRAEVLRQLEDGGLPEAFGYPERARELANRGLTPREYRRHKEAIGAATFSAADVRFT